MYFLVLLYLKLIFPRKETNINIKMFTVSTLTFLHLWIGSCSGPDAIKDTVTQCTNAYDVETESTNNFCPGNYEINFCLTLIIVLRFL